MSRRFLVEMRTTTYAQVRVEVSDETLARVATEYEVPVEEVTVEMLDEVLRDAAYDGSPGGLCIHCGGGGIGSTYSAEHDGDWQVVDDYWQPSDGGEKPNPFAEVTDSSSGRESFEQV